MYYPDCTTHPDVGDNTCEQDGTRSSLRSARTGLETGVNRLTPVNITIHHTIQYQRTRTRRLFPGPALHSRREPRFGGALLAHLRETRNVDPKADLLEWAPAFSIAASHPKGSASRICNSRSL